jgi:hypothetical protein
MIVLMHKWLKKTVSSPLQESSRSDPLPHHRRRRRLLPHHPAAQQDPARYEKRTLFLLFPPAQKPV